MRVILVGLFFVVGFISPALADMPAPKDEKKHTVLGKYTNAQEAYQMWKANPEKAIVLDVRTPEEYAFLGHAPMAYNFPSKLWTGKWVPDKKTFALEDNPDFEAQMKKKFGLNDTILVMCRSGHRSAAAVNRLAKAGFTEVYNIVDGFEGDLVSDPESYYVGKRMLNGWRNALAPWTYDLEPNLVYAPEK
jgi:rhodanese-related sulfurtransferase